MINMGSDALNISKDEVKILKALYENKNELMKADIHVTKKAPYEALVTSGLILSIPISKTSNKYKVSAKGTQYYETNKDGLLTLIEAKKTVKTTTKTDSSTVILSRLDAIEGKIDKLMEIIQKSPASVFKPVDANDNLKTFEIALRDEYKKLKERDFLGDGSVWYQELKKIVMGKYGYQDYQFDELLQSLKKAKLGTILMSQGKDKTWIEIRG